MQTSVHCKCNIYFFLLKVFRNSQCTGAINVKCVSEEVACPIAPSQVSDPLTLPSFDEVQPLVEQTSPDALPTETIEGVPESVYSMRRKVKCALQFRWSYESSHLSGV